MELNKAMLDCMQQLRRKLRAEQNVNVRLSEPDAITHMLAACLRSDDEEIHKLGRQLAEFSDHWQHPNATEPTLPILPPAEAPQGNTAPVRIYRGQRVYG